VHRDNSRRKLNLETKYKHSRIVFAVTSIALTLAPLSCELLKLPAQALIGSRFLHRGFRSLQILPSHALLDKAVVVVKSKRKKDVSLLAAVANDS